MFYEDLPEDLFSHKDANGMLSWTEVVNFCNNLSMIGQQCPKQVSLIQHNTESSYLVNLAIALSITVGIDQINLKLSPQRNQQIKQIVDYLGLNPDKYNKPSKDSTFCIDIVELGQPDQNIVINDLTNLTIIRTMDPGSYKELLISRLSSDYNVIITPKYQLIFCERKIVPKPEVKSMDDISSIYKITLDSSNNYPFLDQTQWVQDLISFMTSLSVQVWGKDNIFIKQGFGEPELKIWIKAFTHESYDRNCDNNYETLEYLGDKIMGSAFAIYLYNMYDHIVNNQLNSLGVFYLSKVRQHNMSQYLQLTKVARTFYDYGIKLSEDLIESLFGAVYLVADRIQYGQGNAMTYQLIQYLFKDITIDLSDNPISPIIDLNELFQLYGWGLIGDDNSRSKRKQLEIFNNNIMVNILPNGRKETCLIVSNQVLETISSNKGISMDQVRQLYPNNCLVRIENEGNMLPNEELADKALQLLDEYNINRKLTNGKSGRIQSEVDYKLALKRACLEGYDDLYFPKISGNSNTYYIQLVGIKATPQDKIKTRHDILITVKMSCKDNPSNVLKPLALKLYIKSGKQPLPYNISC